VVVGGQAIAVEVRDDTVGWRTMSSVDRIVAARGHGWTSAGVALAALIVLVGTAPDFGMAWDEGFTVRRDRTLEGWFSRLIAPPPGHDRAEAFDRGELEKSWPFSRKEPDGHPPFYALLGLAGWWVTQSALNPLSAYRFGAMALCAATAGAVYHHLASRRGRLAGATAAALFLLTPRVFAHAHYAHYDMPMTCLWLLAQMAFLRALASARWAPAFGVLLGLAAGTKFTGCFAAVAPALWVAWTEGPDVWRRVTRGRAGGGGGRRRPGLYALAVGYPVAAVTLYAIQPPWWADPVRGLTRYLVSNLTRSQTKPIPTLYLGRVYGFALPWHNTLVLTAVTVPVAVLVLAGLGLYAVVARRRSDPTAVVWPLSWATLMVVRALPGAPGHDGIRLILPSVASLALLAGFGAAWLGDRLRPRRLAWVAPLAVVVALGECVAGVGRTYPYTDSYYSAAVGGLRGAERLGFEVTYYWETLGIEFQNWLRFEGRRRPVGLRFPSPVITAFFLREWGMIPRQTLLVPFDPAAAPDYPMQRRRGVYLPHDWWLERHGRPSFVVRRQGVDLMRVYPDSEYRRAVVETADEPIPEYINNHFRGSRHRHAPAGP